MWELSSLTRVRLVPSALETWSLSHWTTREVLSFSLFLMFALLNLPSIISSLSHRCILWKRTSFSLTAQESSCELCGLKLPAFSSLFFLPQLATHTSFSKALMSFYWFLIYRNQVGSTKVNENENNAFLSGSIYLLLSYILERGHKSYSSLIFHPFQIHKNMWNTEKKNHKRKRNDSTQLKWEERRGGI